MFRISLIRYRTSNYRKKLITYEKYEKIANTYKKITGTATYNKNSQYVPERFFSANRIFQEAV